ncbi:MAG: ABC transporter permease, partial [Anaerolineales bacterium]|nr:ABC transporter permease [Anaerolineales bacterium]
PTPMIDKPTANSSGLQFRDIIQTAFDNLGRRRVRNVLTAAGVLIGIITLVAMVSMGVGVQREVQRNFESVGLENIFVTATFSQQDEFDPFAAAEAETPLTPALVDELAVLPNVVSVTPGLSMPPGIDITMSVNGQDEPLPVFISGDGGTPFSFGPPGQTALLAGEEPSTTGSGISLISGLADRLLAEGETYDALIGRDVVLTVTLPRGETADFPTTIVGVRSGMGSRSLNAGIEERAAIVSWWYDEPDLLTTEGYDQIVVRAVDLTAVPA